LEGEAAGAFAAWNWMNQGVEFAGNYPLSLKSALIVYGIVA
jgi:hypothetical protein